MNGTLHEIDPSALKQLIDRNEVLLVDVREHFEYQEEHLPGAKLFPTSSFNPVNVPKTNKKIVFYCAAGRRSANAAIKWREHFGALEAYSLKGGIIAWKKTGYPTVVNPGEGMKVQSKAYLIAGLAIVLLSILSFAYPFFLWLILLLGFGFIFSGFSESGRTLLSILISKLFPQDS